MVTGVDVDAGYNAAPEQYRRATHAGSSSGSGTISNGGISRQVDREQQADHCETLQLSGDSALDRLMLEGDGTNS